MFYSSVDELEKDIAGVVDFALYQVQSAHTLLAHELWGGSAMPWASHQVCVQPRLREVHDRDSGVGQLNGPSKPAKDNFPCVLNVSHLATFPVIFYVS